MKDPRRLLDGDGSAEQRALLQAGASEEPPADGSARLLASLGITEPVSTGSTGSAGGESTAGSGLASGGAGAAGAIKVVLAVGTVVLLGAGALLWSRGGRHEPSPRREPRASASTAQQPVAQPAVVDAQPAGSVALEVEVLERARARLNSKDGEGALAILREYARNHPAGVLAQEADVLRVEALILVGKRAAASDLAKRSLEQRGDTPHRARLEGLLQQAGAQPEP